jgi:hypothetical protein
MAPSNAISRCTNHFGEGRSINWINLGRVHIRPVDLLMLAGRVKLAGSLESFTHGCDRLGSKASGDMDERMGMATISP